MGGLRFTFLILSTASFSRIWGTAISQTSNHETFKNAPITEALLDIRVIPREGLDLTGVEAFTEAVSETMFSSSLTDKTSSPAYTEIVQMGWAAVPLILRELSEAPDYWFAALREITGENPVPGEHRGNLEFMANDWLLWARRQGISF